MTQFLLDFEWSRDLAGYDLREPVAPRSMSFSSGSDAGTLLTIAPLTTVSIGKPQLIVRRGGSLEPYRPLAVYRLFERFSKDISPTGMLHFVELFGPLTKAGLEREGDDVQDLIAHATQMRRILDAYAAGHKRELAKIIGPKGIQLGERDGAIADIRASLVFDPNSEAPQLRFTPRNLLYGIWMQLAQRLTAGARLRTCLQCDTIFETGPGTGRRLDAKFCSDQHRFAYHSRKRSVANA